MHINEMFNHGLSSISVEEDLGIAVDSQTVLFFCCFSFFFLRTEKNDGGPLCKRLLPKGRE